MVKQVRKKPDAVKTMKTMWTAAGTWRALALKFMPKLTRDPRVPVGLSGEDESISHCTLLRQSTYCLR